MKTLACISLFLAPGISFGQQLNDRLVAEVSPFTVGIHSSFSYNIQGRITYRFNRCLSLTAGHNQELDDNLTGSTGKSSPYSFRKNTLSDFRLGILLAESKQPQPDPTEEIKPKSWTQKSFQLNLGMTYYRFAAMRTDYYSYARDDQGHYQIINSINRLSASLGCSFLIRENDTCDPDHIRLKRQHTFSAGAYYGLNYDLQGYTLIAGKNPSVNPPKTYAFDRSGYYLSYHFRQQLNNHLYLGAALFFAKMPYVAYRSNPDLFLFRGGEAESTIQPYAGIHAGWVF